MISRFRSEKIIYKLITLAVLAVAVYFVIRTGYAALRSLPYSRELLEPSNVALTNTFIRGESPYSLVSLEWEVPGINYDYPFLNSLFAAAIAKITHCNAVTAHLVISYISILLSGLIGALMVKDRTETTIAPTLAALMFMLCHWRFGYVSAAPDDLGLLIMLATLYAAVSPKVKHKPVVCAIGITLCFYTKQYFIFVAAPIFIYMLLYSRKEAGKLFIYTLVMNVITAVLITMFWPLFWMKTLVFTYLGAGMGGGGKISTIIEQIRYLAVPFAALFVIVFVAAVMGIRKIKKNGDKLRGIRIKENDTLALSTVNVVIMLVPLSMIGRNDGAFLSYFLQLWLHSVAVIALISIEMMKSEKHQRIYACIYMMVALFTVYFGLKKLPHHILTDEEIADWQKAYSYTQQYGSKGEIFYSRSLAFEGFEYGNGDMQCGHEGEVGVTTQLGMQMSDIPIEWFPYVDELTEQNIKYREDILEKAEDHKYTLITFEPNTDALLLHDSNCALYGYTCIDSLTLRLGNMPFEVEFYALN